MRVVGLIRHAVLDEQGFVEFDSELLFVQPYYHSSHQHTHEPMEETGQSHLTGSVGTCPCSVVLYARAVGMTLT